MLRIYRDYVLHHAQPLWVIMSIGPSSNTIIVKPLSTTLQRRSMTLYFDTVV